MPEPKQSTLSWPRSRNRPTPRSRSFAQILAAAPGAEELINYGVPMIRVGGRNVVSFAAAKTHCSFFVQSPAVMEQFAAELTAFDTAKGTIRFKPEKPIPAALVKKIVKARIAENKALAAAKSGT